MTSTHEGGVVASRLGCDDTRNVIPQAVLYCIRLRAQQDAEIGAPRRFRHRGSGVSGTVPHTIWTATVLDGTVQHAVSSPLAGRYASRGELDFASCQLTGDSFRLDDDRIVPPPGLEGALRG